MFFTSISQMMTESVDLTLVIRKANGQLTVSTLPKANGLKDEAHPGHLATAVGFNEDVAGDYLMVNGKKYVVCDPTYINARVGMTMPKMDNSSAIAVTL